MRQSPILITSCLAIAVGERRIREPNRKASALSERYLIIYYELIYIYLTRASFPGQLTFLDKRCLIIIISKLFED